MLNWIVWNRTDYLHKMDLALNNLQRLICYKTQTTNQLETEKEPPSTEMKLKILKTEHHRTQHYKINVKTRKQNKRQVNKENQKQKGDNIIIRRKLRLKKKKVRKWKGKQFDDKLITNIPTENIAERNEQIYAGAKLVCDKIDIPLRNTKRN